MTVEEIKEKLRKKAVVFMTGGIRPTNELGESWVGKVCWKLPDEEEPINEKGQRLTPIATIFLDGLEYIPDALKNVKMINIFMDEDIWDNLVADDYSNWFKINLYDDLGKLVPCNYISDKMRDFPLIPRIVEDDYPMWEDLDDDLIDIISDMEETDGIDYFTDIFEKNYDKHKIGGYPSTIQGGVGFDDCYEYVLQIATDEKANFNIVDAGNFYFAYNPKLNSWSIRCDFY